MHNSILIVDDERGILERRKKMNQTVSAIYENGVLKLEKLLEIADGVKVEIVVIAPNAKTQKKNSTELLAKVAALPSESAGEKFSGREHDRILYGERE